VDTLNWLLESDPAIRWQAMRDLTDASAATIAAERARVPFEGLGAEILACQNLDGGWRRDGSPVWLPTLFTLLLLRSTGVDRAEPVILRAVARLETGLRWDDKEGCWDLRRPEPDARPFFEGEVEPCINGGTLALGAYFGHPTKSLACRLVGEQLDDGGWNCDAPPSRRSSFHTTICVLEGLLEFEHAVGSAPEIDAARRRGEEYLLERRLFRRRSTGNVVDPAFLELAFPPRYHYDVLRALDYFRATGSAPDPRVADAVSLVAGRMGVDGRWPLDRAYDEALPFGLGEAAGKPSQWNTLRALRVLRWYEEGATHQRASS
jgi:hypothetical protein